MGGKSFETGVTTEAPLGEVEETMARERTGSSQRHYCQTNPNGGAFEYRALLDGFALLLPLVLGERLIFGGVVGVHRERMNA